MLKVVKHRMLVVGALLYGISVAAMGAAQAEPIKVGVIAPTTGPGAGWGVPTAYGVRFAADRINAAGGIDVNGKKEKVEVIVYDDQYKAADAVAAYNRLINQDGAKYVVIMTTTGTQALVQQVEEDDVLMLTATYNADVIGPHARHMMRVYSIPADYLPGFVSWLQTEIPERKIALINPNDEPGWNHVRVLDPLLKQSGFEVVANEVTERAMVDFQALLTRILATSPEIIDVGTVPPATAGLIVRQARELGFKGQFIKTGGAGPADIVAAAGPEASNGMISMLWADPDNEGFRALAEQYQKAIGQQPNDVIAIFYDAANVLFEAIHKAGTADDVDAVAAAFAQALPMPSVQGAELTLGGMAAYGVDRQIMTTHYIARLENGTPKVIGAVK